MKRFYSQSSGHTSDGDGSLQRDLDIAVVGAGVGGLSAAIALKKAGFHVTIYEAASALGEVFPAFRPLESTCTHIFPEDRRGNSSSAELKSNFTLMGSGGNSEQKSSQARGYLLETMAKW